MPPGSIVEDENQLSIGTDTLGTALDPFGGHVDAHAAPPPIDRAPLPLGHGDLRATGPKASALPAQELQPVNDEREAIDVYGRRGRAIAGRAIRRVEVDSKPDDDSLEPGPTDDALRQYARELLPAEQYIIRPLEPHVRAVPFQRHGDRDT
jgi:hypothetical protein